MAFSMDFITHGGFEIVSSSWQFISNLMANPAYRSAVSTIFLTTIFFSAISGSLSGLFRGAGGTMYQWMGAAIVAILMYAGMFQAGFGPWHLQGKLAVYDDLKNKNTIISNLPVGLVALAGSLNKAQVGMENIIKNTISGSYISNEEPMGIKMLREASSGRLKSIIYSLIPEEVKRSLLAYIDKDVSVVATAEPAIKHEIDHTTDLMTAFGDAANPAIFMVTWLDSSGQPSTTSEVVDGGEAWRRLKAYLNNPNNLQTILQKFCQEFSFDATGTSFNQCTNIIDNVVNTLLVPGKNKDDLTRNIFLGAMWRDYVAQLDSSVAIANAIATQQTQSSLMASGIAAEEWLPHMKVVLTALIIGITPIILLFIASSFSLKAFQVLIGLYLWLLFWAVMDQTAECFWVNEAMRVWNTVSSVSGGAGFGVKGQELYWSLASQTLAVLGGMRSMGMMLAGVVTYGILGFGGSMFSHMLHGITGQVTAGSGLGGEALHPAATAQTRFSKSSADQLSWAGTTGLTNPNDWLLSGYSRGISTITRGTAASYFNRSMSEVTGRQNFENSWAHTKASSNLSQFQKELGQVESMTKSYSQGETTDLGMKTFGIDDRATAQRFLSSQITLGMLNSQQREAVLRDVFGDRFVNRVKQRYGAQRADEIFKNAFGGLTYKGVPGKKGELKGTISKQGAEVLGNYLKDELKQDNAGNTLLSMAHSDKEGAIEFDGVGGKDFGGLAVASARQGANSRIFNIGMNEAKQYEYGLSHAARQNMDYLGVDSARAERIATEGVSLKSLNEQQRDKILDQHFGKGFSDYVRKNYGEEALEKFGNFRFRGEAGKAGILTAKNVDAGTAGILKNYLASTGRKDIASQIQGGRSISGLSMVYDNGKLSSKINYDSSRYTTEGYENVRNKVEEQLNSISTPDYINQNINKLGVDTGTAQRIATEGVSLKSLNEQQRDKVLDQHFGKGFSDYVRKNYGEEALEKFGNFRFRGEAGKAGILTAKNIDSGTAGILKKYLATTGRKDIASQIQGGRSISGLSMVYDNGKLSSEMSYEGGQQFVTGGYEAAKQRVEGTINEDSKAFEYTKIGSGDTVSRESLLRGINFRDLDDVAYGGEGFKAWVKNPLTGNYMQLSDVLVKKVGSRLEVTGTTKDGNFITIVGTGGVSPKGRQIDFKSGKVFEGNYMQAKSDNILMQIGGKGKWIRGSGSLERTKEGYMEFKGIFQPDQLKTLAELEKDQGNIRAYNKLMDLAEKKKPVDVSLKTDGSQIVDLSANNEAIVQEKDVAGTSNINKVDIGNRINIGDDEKYGDSYKIKDTTLLDDIVINGNVKKAENYGKDWFVVDNNGHVLGASEKGITTARQAGKFLGSLLQVNSQAESGIMGEGGISSGLLKVIGLKFGAKRWAKLGKQEKIDLIQSNIIKNFQEIAMDDSYGSTSEEKARAVAEYFNLVYTTIMNKTSPTDYTKTFKERIKDMEETNKTNELRDKIFLHH